MLLYEHPLSSYAQKVKIALREKGLAFDLETPEALGTGIAAGPFGEANPRAEVPALVDGEARIFDSTIILEYIEEKWPTPPLLPRDPAARAAARMVEDVCDTHYEAITHQTAKGLRPAAPARNSSRPWRERWQIPSCGRLCTALLDCREPYDGV
jgi:glutathione S-transferase